MYIIVLTVGKAKSATYVKHQVFNIDGLAQYVLLFFTPMYEILQLFSEREVFIASDMLLAVVGGGVYFLVAVVFGYWFYSKRVCGPLIAKQERFCIIRRLL